MPRVPASDGMALAAYGNGKCAHCGRPGHSKKNCFHNPGCPAYKPHFIKKFRGHLDEERDLSSANYAV